MLARRLTWLIFPAAFFSFAVLFFWMYVGLDRRLAPPPSEAPNIFGGYSLALAFALVFVGAKWPLLLSLAAAALGAAPSALGVIALSAGAALLSVCLFGAESHIEPMKYLSPDQWAALPETVAVSASLLTYFVSRRWGPSN
jgi:hypothetical protein